MRPAYTVPVFVLTLFLLSSCLNKRSIKRIEDEERTGAREARERDIKMMKDPALGYVPTERLIAAKQYKDQLVQTNGPLSGVEWNSLGPKNQGGRSRTMLIDANDVTGNTVFAGSVGGGLWKTTNISAASPTWVAVDDLMGNLAITSIAQDPTNAQVIYVSTGEGYFNGDAIQGLGVWKSTNGGTSWSQLASTNNSNFYYCQKIVVNSTGVVLVATSTGLRRSVDGGTIFTKVLGTGLGITGAVSNHCYDVEIAANGDVYGSLNTTVHKSTDAGATFGAAQTLSVAASRIELACAPSDANYVYALCESGSVISGVMRTTNGGGTWTTRTEPNDADPGVPDADFSRQQAWYDLSIAIDPNNKDVLFVGGIDLFKSTDGAGSWTQVSHWYGGFGFQYVHADQHHALYKTGSSSEMYFVNDGGIYRTTNANTANPTITDKGVNYVTAQFYACAMHPTAVTNHFLAGAQDNGSHLFTSGIIQNTTQVTGGDGAFCHIDQDEPQYQFTSYVYNDFYRSTDGGTTWTNVTTTNGSFISPTDYDDVNDILYMCNTSGTYRRWNNPQSGNSFNSVNGGFGDMVSAIKVSPNTAHRVFFGTEATGDVFRVDNANVGGASTTNISTGLPTGYVSSIEVETGNDNHLLVTYSNYGLNSIWESTNGGTSWTSVEGNLPDMPIRWALFNPTNNDQVIVATELGVWSTDNLNGGGTVWGASNSGLANVRVDMLQVRTSDKLVIAATHGRGLFYSDLFTSPTALFDADKKITYIGKAVNFSSTSYKGTSWSWNFGDGYTSTTENPSHIYGSPGKYNVTLSINSGASTIVKNQFIHVLPNKGTPYLIADGGGFETNTDNFGVYHTYGTSWERGNSAVAGKQGVHAGSNAWVTGLVGNYVDNTETSLMTPNYNFTLPGTYTLTFWSRSNTESDFDGFRVEYSLDKGDSWTALGTTTAAGWYNSANISGTTIFPANEAFFSDVRSPYAQSTRNVSFLATNANVAFRFIFKADGNVTGVGAAVDDFEITGPANTGLPLLLTSFKAYKQNADVMLKWNTENEQNSSHFIIERSSDGMNFQPIGTVHARNLSQDQYTYPDLVSRLPVRPTGYLYYRLKMVDNDNSFTYSPIARISLSTNNLITVGPNPFSDHLFIYSSVEVKKLILIDMSGRQLFRTTSISGNRVNLPSIPKGNYIVRIETADGVETRKISKGN
ncbi:MAG TPA: PKD domain-containing protein [Chitinophagaceae bacterium]|nr:PKD domain-containing protein [Chitinophagaceae bacterium]